MQKHRFLALTRAGISSNKNCLSDESAVLIHVGVYGLNADTLDHHRSYLKVVISYVICVY